MAHGNGGGHGTPYWKIMIRRTAMILFIVNVFIVFAPALLNYFYTDQGFFSPSLYLIWPSIGFWMLAAALMGIFNIT